MSLIVSTFLIFCKIHLLALLLAFISGLLFFGAYLKFSGPEDLFLWFMLIICSLPWSWLWSLTINLIFSPLQIPIPKDIYVWGIAFGFGLNTSIATGIVCFIISPTHKQPSTLDTNSII